MTFSYFSVSATTYTCVRPPARPPRLRIPIRLVDGVWESAFGGAVPVTDDAEAELIIEREFISDRAFLERMETNGLHKVLDEGTTLLVALTIKPDNPPPDELRPLLKYYDKLSDVIATESLKDWNWNPRTLASSKLGWLDRTQNTFVSSEAIEEAFGSGPEGSSPMVSLQRPFCYPARLTKNRPEA